jgi:WD40 repeat protein
MQWHVQPGLITFWDWRTGKKRFPTVNAPSEPASAALSPDGNTLAIVCAGGHTLLIDAATAQTKTAWSPPAPVGKFWGSQPKKWALFSPDGTRLVTLGLGNSAYVWETLSGKLCYVLTHKGFVRDAAFSRDGRSIMTASEDHSVRIWSVSDGTSIGECLKHPDWVFSLELSPDGSAILTACRDHMARLWSLERRELLCAPLEHEDEIMHAVFVPGSDWILTACRDGSVRLWDSFSGKPISTLLRWSLGDQSSVLARHISLSPDGRYSLVAFANEFLGHLDLSNLLDRNSRELDLDDASLIAEIISGRRIAESGHVNLTTEEWLNSWRAIRRKLPSYHQVVGIP